MIIVLNDELKETPSRVITEEQLNYFIKELKSNIPGYKWNGPDYNVLSKFDISNINSFQTGYLNILSNAYSKHNPIVLAPHDIWYLILTEINHIIKTNTEQLRPLFSKSAEKIELLVPTNDVEKINLFSVIDQLKEQLPIDTGIFLPEFSTHTDNSKYACMAAFCDGMSRYYNYMTYCCGIPKVKIIGSDQDWEMITTHLVEIYEMFKICDMDVSSWFNRINDIVYNIRNALAGGDQSFMMNIFSQENIGSGGQKNIDGWFKDIFIKNTERRLESFSYTLSTVPYKNLETGREFFGLHGCLFSRKDTDGFVISDYNEVIYEKIIGK